MSRVSAAEQQARDNAPIIDTAELTRRAAQELARERAIHEAWRNRERLTTLVRRIDRRLSSDYAPFIPAGMIAELKRATRGGETILASFSSRVFPLADTDQIIEWNAGARSWIARAEEVLHG
jgi:hypothetical protein